MEEPIQPQQQPKESNLEVVTPEQTKIKELLEIIEQFNFFSNQLNVNITLFQGFKLILDKITKIEEKLYGK